MIKIKIVAFILALSQFVLAQKTLVLKAEELKSLVEKQSERIQAKEFEVQAAESRKGYLTRSFLPQLEVYASQETFKKGVQDQKSQPAYGAEARINVFNGGRDLLESSKRDLKAERVKYERTVVLAEELQKARKLYWTLLYLKELDQVMNEALKTNESNLKSAQRRIQSGVGTEIDRVEFEMNAVDLRREKLRVAQETESTRRELLVVIGHDPETALSLPEALTHEHEWEALVIHKESDHLELTRPMELRAEEISEQAKIDGRSWLPKLDAFAAYNQFNQREEDSAIEEDRKETVMGIRLSLSLDSAIQGNAEASSLKNEARAAKLEASYAKREIENHIHSEMSELRLLHSLVHEADDNIARANKYYKLTQSEYSRGVKNSPDVLGASEKVFEASKRHLEILKDFQISKTHILSKIGK